MQHLVRCGLGIFVCVPCMEANSRLGFVSVLNNMAYLVQGYVRSAEAWPPDDTILTS